MKIKTIHLSGNGGRALDTPIRFPAPCQPDLLTAPDTKIKIRDSEMDNPNIDNRDSIVRTEDAKRSINFGGKVLANSLEITVKDGNYGPDGPFFFFAKFPDGKKYRYWFASKYLRAEAYKLRTNIGKFVQFCKDKKIDYERIGDENN